MSDYKRVRGRGAFQNETSRFFDEKLVLDYGGDGWWVEDESLPTFRTEFLTDSSKSVLSKNNSPDIGFTYSANPYRGCEHGCAYCYARPTHEYLGHSAGIDFESKIYVKHRAPELLFDELMRPSWKSEPIAFSGVTDCYQPAERRFELTRKCPEVLLRFRNPAYFITKNALIMRDLDLLSQMAKLRLVHVFISVTTLNAELARKLEPRTSSPAGRLRAIEELAKASIPVGVNVAPSIPGLTDLELPAILKAAKDSGAMSAGYTPLRLPYSVKDVFSQWLEENMPERKSKVLNAIKDIRGGQLNDSAFKSRMRGQGERARSQENMFKMFRRKFGLDQKFEPLDLALFQRPGDQLSLF